MGKFIFILVSFLLSGFFGLLAVSLSSVGTKSGIAVNETFGELSVNNRILKDFSLDLFDGGSIKLSDLKGEVVVLDFWSSWCVQCRKEAPVLSQAYSEYEHKGVSFVGINVWDTEADATSYREAFGLTYPAGPDKDGIILMEYGVRGIPEKLIINKDGRLVRKLVGPSSIDSLRLILDETLNSSR